MMNIAELTTLAQDLIAAEHECLRAEQLLKNAKEAARVLREVTIPNVMDELGLQDITLDTGQKLFITQEVYASIPAKCRDEAFAWLNANGFGALIKTQLKTVYGKGERENAAKLQIELSKRGLDTVMEESVHPQTLKAFIKEQIKNGNKIPLDLFGAQPVSIAKIK